MEEIIVRAFALDKSLVLVLPQRVRKSLNVSKGQEFSVQVNNGEITYKPISKSLAAMKKGEVAMKKQEKIIEQAREAMDRAKAAMEEALEKTESQREVPRPRC